MPAAHLCHLICGNDTYKSSRLLKAIEDRFLSQQDSMTDLIRYDLDDISLETLKQTMLATPFFVQRRLFILKNALTAPKATQEGLKELLGKLTNSTYVVLYEPKACDKRLTLYTWLKTHAKIDDCTMPEAAGLTAWVQALAAKDGVQINLRAAGMLSGSTADTQQLGREVEKLVCAAKAYGRTTISEEDVFALCALQSEESLFALTNALRDGNRAEVIRCYRRFLQEHDPLLIAGTIAAHIRTLAKIVLCQERGITQPDAIVRSTGLNPYVVKLTLPQARRVSLHAIQRSYKALIRFDASAKDGTAPPSLGLLLLILRLHDTLNREKPLVR
jgi:DNA polymerase III subunit delta